MSFRGGRITFVLRPALIFFLIVFAAAAFAEPNPSGADQNSELPQLYTRGMTEFQGGDYAKAAVDLEALIAKAEFTPQLEPAFFTLGSAHFNAGEYNKDGAAFKKYLEKFPNRAHASEAAFALAQSSLLAKNYPDAAAQFA